MATAHSSLIPNPAVSFRVEGCWSLTCSSGITLGKQMVLLPTQVFLFCCNKKQKSCFILHRNSWLQVHGSLSSCGAFGHSPKQVQQGRAAEPHTPPSLVSQTAKELGQFTLLPSVQITLAQAGALRHEFYKGSEKVELLWESFPFIWLLLSFGKIWE